MTLAANNHALNAREYVFKKHHATHLHYDLRLEWKGVLLSWALSGGPSYRVGEEREAIEMPDHRKEYRSFEGVHETGPIMLWDCGMWVPDHSCADVESSLRTGVLRFKLFGEKLRGSWTLSRVKGATNTRPAVWTLCKQADEFAEEYFDRCVLKELPNSVATGRTLEQIDRDWFSPKENVLQGQLFVRHSYEPRKRST